jgi:hypothetical protein
MNNNQYNNPVGGVRGSLAGTNGPYLRSVLQLKCHSAPSDGSCKRQCRLTRPSHGAPRGARAAESRTTQPGVGSGGGAGLSPLLLAAGRRVVESDCAASSARARASPRSSTTTSPVSISAPPAVVNGPGGAPSPTSQPNMIWPSTCASRAGSVASNWEGRVALSPERLATAR